MRYDLRRHRLKHFNADGSLSDKGIKEWQALNPDKEAPAFVLQDLEKEFNATVNEMWTLPLTEESDDKGKTFNKVADHYPFVGGGQGWRISHIFNKVADHYTFVGRGGKGGGFHIHLIKWQTITPLWGARVEDFTNI